MRDREWGLGENMEGGGGRRLRENSSKESHLKSLSSVTRLWGLVRHMLFRERSLAQAVHHT